MLQLLLAKILKTEIKLVVDLVMYGTRNTNSTILRQPFKPRCDVDAITVIRDVAEIDAHAGDYWAVRRGVDYFFRQP